MPAPLPLCLVHRGRFPHAWKTHSPRHHEHQRCAPFRPPLIATPTSSPPPQDRGPLGNFKSMILRQIHGVGNNTPKRMGRPLTGCCHVRELRARSAACNSPLAGGAANSGPMMANRSRAHRSRSAGSPRSVKGLLPPCGDLTVRTGSVWRVCILMRLPSSAGAPGRVSVPHGAAPENVVSQRVAIRDPGRRSAPAQPPATHRPRPAA